MPISHREGRARIGRTRIRWAACHIQLRPMGSLPRGLTPADPCPCCSVLSSGTENMGDEASLDREHRELDHGVIEPGFPPFFFYLLYSSPKSASRQKPTTAKHRPEQKKKKKEQNPRQVNSELSCLSACGKPCVPRLLSAATRPSTEVQPQHFPLFLSVHSDTRPISIVLHSLAQRPAPPRDWLQHRGYGNPSTDWQIPALAA